jgi:glycosyltransferase involved in cell wall biosynthesis
MQAAAAHLAPEHDLLLASQVWTSQYALRGDGRLKEMPKVLEELEIATFYEGYGLESGWFWRLRYQPMWWKFKRLVREAASTFSGITVASEQELNLLQEIGGSHRPSTVVSNGVDLSYYQCNVTPQPNKLIFSGALTYFANYGAMDWFLHHVYPLIQAQEPDVQLDITGGTTGAALDGLPRRQGVTFTGYLPDIRPEVAGSWACVVPLHVGGGTRLKILEALALGTPVVSTRKGAEGLDLRPEQDLLIADEPAEFARQTVRLLRDPDLRAHLATNGRRAVARYDWSIIGDELNRFLEKVAGRS